MDMKSFHYHRAIPQYHNHHIYKRTNFYWPSSRKINNFHLSKHLQIKFTYLVPYHHLQPLQLHTKAIPTLHRCTHCTPHPCTWRERHMDDHLECQEEQGYCSIEDQMCFYLQPPVSSTHQRTLLATKTSAWGRPQPHLPMWQQGRIWCIWAYSVFTFELLLKGWLLGEGNFIQKFSGFNFYWQKSRLQKLLSHQLAMTDHDCVSQGCLYIIPKLQSHTSYLSQPSQPLVIVSKFWVKCKIFHRVHERKYFECNFYWMCNLTYGVVFHPYCNFT